MGKKICLARNLLILFLNLPMIVMQAPEGKLWSLTFADGMLTVVCSFV